MIILKVIRQFAFNLLYVLDTVLNTLIGGDPRETISSRLGKGQVAGKPVHSELAKVVNFFFELVFNEQHHCKNSIIIAHDNYSISSVIEREKAKQ